MSIENGKGARTFQVRRAIVELLDGKLGKEMGKEPKAGQEHAHVIQLSSSCTVCKTSSEVLVTEKPTYDANDMLEIAKLGWRMHGCTCAKVLA